MAPSVLLRGIEKIEEPVRQDTLTARYTEEAIAFIERAQDRPFLLYLAHTMPHIPLHASERFRGRSPAGLYGDAVEEVDWSVGEILSALRRFGLDRDTLVAFSSDNGPWYEGSPGPLRGRKGWTYEGGVRVPGLFRWPGQIRAGVSSDEPACTLDVFPTAAAVAGFPDPASASRLPLDGRNVLSLLRGGQTRLPDRLLAFFDTVYLQTARYGPWKIHVARWRVPRYVSGYSDKNNVVLKTPELYNVALDPSESYNLATDRADVVRDLRGRIADALATFPAEIQEANRELLS